MSGARSKSGGDRRLGVDNFPQSMPTKPENLPARQTVIWNELLEQIPNDALRSIDSHQLTLLVELLTQSEALALLVRADASDGGSQRLYLAVVDRVAKLSSMFGLSPRCRAAMKLEVPTGESDPFLDYLADVKLARQASVSQ